MSLSLLDEQQRCARITDEERNASWCLWSRLEPVPLTLIGELLLFRIIAFILACQGYAKAIARCRLVAVAAHATAAVATAVPRAALPSLGPCACRYSTR